MDAAMMAKYDEILAARVALEAASVNRREARDRAEAAVNELLDMFETAKSGQTQLDMGEASE